MYSHVNVEFAFKILSYMYRLKANYTFINTCSQTHLTLVMKKIPEPICYSNQCIENK